MADEPRRSGRATKGQHKHASSSPAPAVKPAKTAKSKPPKKSLEPEREDEEGGEEEEIRCICGNSNPNDKRAFIGCDACTVWQHNVCMGMPEDEDDVPEHYFCEQCRPEEHQETIRALEAGEKIWETRNKIYQNEKKMSKNRKGKGNMIPGWLKKEVPEATTDGQDGAEAPQESGTKRKRDEVKEEEPAQEAEEEKPTRATRQDKRRKSSAPEERAQPEAETAIVTIDKLPTDRQKIATALSKIITDAVGDLAKAGFAVPSDQTAKSLGDRNASLIEYELQMVHEGPSNPTYMAQFRALNANLKRNRVLVERIINGSLTANDLATMESKDMASEELQKERATMKEQLDRQAVAIQETEGPRYRRTHKGDELIEDENQHLKNVTATATAQPVRERVSIAEGEDGVAQSPTETQQEQLRSPVKSATQTPAIDSARPTTGQERRQSSQNFDMNNIWAKTAGSPTNASSGRRMPLPPRRQSSNTANTHEQDGGTKDDADVDRMLQDDDDSYGATGDVVWRGKLIQSADGSEPTVNARWIAGRDMSSTTPWGTLLQQNLTIDGRLQIAKAEEYLCSLQWSDSSDVTVLALTPYDDADAFAAIFQYFKSRGRYAVVNKDKPTIVRDMYIIPVEAGGALPEHMTLLEHCDLKSPTEENLLLATLVLVRDPNESAAAASHDASTATNAPAGANGQNIPQHLRSGPAGSPVTAQPGVFSPNNNNNSGSTQPGPPPSYSGIPPNPYTQTPPPPQQAPMIPHPNPLVAEVLGTLQYAPTAQQVISAQPNIDRDRLQNLKRIMEEDPLTRTDINALGKKLLG